MFVCMFVRSFVRSFVPSFVPSFVRSSVVYLFTLSLVQSLVRSFNRSLVLSSLALFTPVKQSLTLPMIVSVSDCISADSCIRDMCAWISRLVFTCGSLYLGFVTLCGTRFISYTREGKKNCYKYDLKQTTLLEAATNISQ